MARTIKVFSANIQRSITNIDGVLQRAVRHRYQVVCIQEPPILFGRVRRHLGFTLYAIDDSSTRAAIFVDRRLSASAPMAPNPGLVSISLNGLTIVNVYLHPNFDIAIETWRTLHSFPVTLGPTVVVGDFNTHHPDRDPRARPNPKGDIVRAWIASRELIILNPQAQPTEAAASLTWPWAP